MKRIHLIAASALALCFAPAETCAQSSEKEPTPKDVS
jgi:hypothetical protein